MQIKNYVDTILKTTKYIIIFGHKDLDGFNAVHQFIKYIKMNHVHIKIVNYEFCSYAVSKIEQINTLVNSNDITYAFLDLNINYSEIKHINKLIFLDHHSNQDVLEVANNKQLYYKSVYTKCATMIVNDLHYNKIYNYTSKLVNAFDTGQVNLFLDYRYDYSSYEYIKKFYDEILLIYQDINEHYHLFNINDKDYSFENITTIFSNNIKKDNIVLAFNLCNYTYITEYIVSILCKYTYNVLGFNPYLMLFIIDNGNNDNYKISIRSDTKVNIDTNYLKNCLGIEKSYGHNSAKGCFWRKDNIQELRDNVDYLNMVYKERLNGF